jgi:uncharacterized protein
MNRSLQDFVGILALAVSVAAGCGGDGGASPSGPADASGGGDDDDDDGGSSGFERRALLAHLANDLLLPTYEGFATAAAGLVTAIEAHCDALGAGQDGAASLAAAQAAWRDAIDRWERADTVLVGPAAMDSRALRDRIYAWPLAATCGVDQDVVAHFQNPGAYDVGTRLNNVRSLAAIEYLLFATSTQHTCPTPLPAFDALGADLPEARCGLAAALAADVAAQGEIVASGWRASGGNYLRELSAAGTSDSSIPSAQEGVNHVSDGLFYVDRIVKDMKLGEAAGIVENSCGEIGEACDREVEHRHADHATQAIRINLATLREVFTGDVPDAPGPGFDDFLISVGAEEVATRMTASIDGAIAAADALPESFLTGLHGEPARVVAAHAALKLVTDDLKSQFLTVLGLEIPDEVAGDND